MSRTSTNSIHSLKASLDWYHADWYLLKIRNFKADPNYNPASNNIVRKVLVDFSEWEHIEEEEKIIDFPNFCWKENIFLNDTIADDDFFNFRNTFLAFVNNRLKHAGDAYIPLALRADLKELKTHFCDTSLRFIESDFNGFDDTDSQIEISELNASQSTHFTRIKNILFDWLIQEINSIFIERIKLFEKIRDLENESTNMRSDKLSKMSICLKIVECDGIFPLPLSSYFVPLDDKLTAADLLFTIIWPQPTISSQCYFALDNPKNLHLFFFSIERAGHKINCEAIKRNEWICYTNGKTFSDSAYRTAKCRIIKNKTKPIEQVINLFKKEEL